MSTPPLEVLADINERADRIRVFFPYHPTLVKAAKGVDGYRFVPREDGGPYWQYPLDLTTARRLREAYGELLKLGGGLRAWGKLAVAKERNLAAVASADDWPVDDLVIAKKLPKLAEWLMPFQRADVAMMRTAENVMNLNQPRLGKTAETIAAVYESGVEDGPHLVSAPVTSHDVVWRFELERWQPHPVLFGNDPREREEAIKEAVRLNEAGEPFWLVLNPAFIRLFRDKTQEQRMIEGKLQHPMVPRYPELEAIVWNSITVDEFHKTGLTNEKTLMARAFKRLTGRRKYALSGTPIGGKPIKLWPILNWLEPSEYTAKWRWAKQWLEVDDNGFGLNIGGLQSGREDDFYKSHSRHMIRRLRAEVAPQLPAKQYIDVPCPMTPKQRKQYKAMERDAEVRISGQRLVAKSVLAEYSRLKQFANAYCELNEKGKVIPTEESGKLPFLLERLDENGIRPDDPEGTSVAVVASESKEMVNMVTAWLRDQGIDAAAMTGDTKPADRTRLMNEFRDQEPGGLRVLVMTTTTGGVSITLDNADVIHVLDETWDPDDQEQLEDRIVSLSNGHITAYYYRTTGSVQEEIHEVAGDKAITNSNVLDIYRAIERRRDQEQEAA